MKLDEKRLLGETGFPVLRKELKRFKLRGKGREVRFLSLFILFSWNNGVLRQQQRVQRDDLKRLLSLYQLWAHSMFPSVSFRDAVETIEKVCHKRVMQVRRVLFLLFLVLVYRECTVRAQAMATRGLRSGKAEGDRGERGGGRRRPCDRHSLRRTSAITNARRRRRRRRSHARRRPRIDPTAGRRR